MSQRRIISSIWIKEYLRSPDRILKGDYPANMFKAYKKELRKLYVIGSKDRPYHLSTYNSFCKTMYYLNLLDLIKRTTKGNTRSKTACIKHTQYYKIVVSSISVDAEAHSYVTLNNGDDPRWESPQLYLYKGKKAPVKSKSDKLKVVEVEKKIPMRGAKSAAEEYKKMSEKPKKKEV